MNTDELLGIVRNLKEKPAKNINEHVLILDGLNTLIRAFSVSASLNATGHHVGGLTGFLKSLGFLNRTFNPSRIIVVWDGIGGAQNRKNQDSNYKAQRAHASVIHYDLYETKAEEMSSLQEQASRLQDYLYCLPITYIEVPKLEADDVIAYLAKNFSAAGREVKIVSTDKDFLQLVDSNVSVYSPTKKVLYNYEEAVRFLEVLPENYNIVKALVGDNSDGLVGVNGIGLKTLVKIFPELQTDPGLTLDSFFTLCSERAEQGKSKCTKILSEWHRVEKNYKLMDLQETVLDEEEKQTVIRMLKEPVGTVRVGPFLHYLSEDRIEFVKDPEGWVCSFSSLVPIAKKT